MNILTASGKYGGLRAMLPTLRELARTNHVSCVLTDQHEVHVGESTRLLVEAGVTPIDATGGTRSDALTEMQVELMTRAQMDGDVSAVLVYGDRLDAMLAAAWAYEQRIPVMHLQAGDVSGGVDDGYRMAIAHLASEHFAPTQEAARRLWAVEGVDEHTVHIVGDHHLDAVRECTRDDRRVNPMQMIVHLHPDTLATEDENKDVANAVWRLVEDYARDFWMIYVLPPCTDRLRSCTLWPKVLCEHTNVCFPGHLRMETYVHMLQQSTLFLGNSSTAVIECPFLHLRAVTVGNRQRGRDIGINGGSTYASIKEKVEDTLRRPVEWRFTRGLGKAWEPTVAIMRERGYAA